MALLRGKLLAGALFAGWLFGPEEDQEQPTGGKVVAKPRPLRFRPSVPILPRPRDVEADDALMLLGLL